MNDDVFDYQIHIDNFSSLLLSLILVCFFGLCATAWRMFVISRFFLNKNGSRFSILNFELPYSFTKFKNIIENISDKTKDAVRMNLKLDYFFMPFAYLFLFFGGLYMLHRQHLLLQDSNAYKILWLPFAAWLFDIMENMLSVLCLEKLTQTKSRLLFFVSLVKWIVIYGFLILLYVIVFRKISI
jgi:hypothetical protein